MTPEIRGAAMSVHLDVRFGFIFLILLRSTLAFPGGNNIAAALITPAPAYNPKFFEKRAGDQTCGYISGDPNAPIVCPGTSSCSFAADHWGCCDQLTCDSPQTCQLDSSPYCAGVNSANCIYSQIRVCSDACVTYVRRTTVGGSNSISSWTCGPTPQEILVYASTTTGGDTSSPTQTTDSTTGGTSGGGSAGTSDEGGSSTQGGLTHGAIAGIAVGSVVGAIIIISSAGAIIYRFFPSIFKRKPVRTDDQRTDYQSIDGGVPKPPSIVELSERPTGRFDDHFEDDRRSDDPAADELRSQDPRILR